MSDKPNSNDSLKELIEYYNRRAKDIENIYSRDIPQQQEEQDTIAERVSEIFACRKVLEIACGTGYWTRFAAESADKITATDASQEMLSVAETKDLPNDQVQFLKADAYELSNIPGGYDGGLAMFWLSHVPIGRLKEFLEEFHSKLENGAIIYMADNTYIKGVGGELVYSETEPDSFKIRTMEDGSVHRVLKNYYTANDLAHILDPYAEDMKIRFGKYFWSVEYKYFKS